MNLSSTYSVFFDWTGSSSDCLSGTALACFSVVLMSIESKGVLKTSAQGSLSALL